jgi:hypothetical protein
LHRNDEQPKSGLDVCDGVVDFLKHGLPLSLDRREKHQNDRSLTESKQS